MPSENPASTTSPRPPQPAPRLRGGPSRPHVARNSGNNEWYTPPDIIEAARRVLGGIDLDPASSDAANVVVGARTYYTAEDDGLEQPWRGRVWMNPPYHRGLMAAFCERLLNNIRYGAVTSAIVLVNNATETEWGQTLLRSCSAVCFPERRIRFLAPDGVKNTPLQGQMITYHSPCNPERLPVFISEFSRFGVVVR